MGFVGSILSAPIGISEGVTKGVEAGVNSMGGSLDDLIPTSKYGVQMAPIQGQPGLGQNITDAQNTSTQQLAAQQGLQNQLGGQNAISNQNALAQQLMAQSQGQGPNPAADMLQAATNQNIQQAAGTIAGTKGINSALAARLAAQNQASTTQQAANQASILRANQQLASQQALGNLTQGQIGNLLGNQNAINTQGLNQQQIYQGAQGNQNNAINQAYGNYNNSNVQQGLGNAQIKTDLFKGIISGAGAAGAMMASDGAVVPGTAEVPGDSPKNDKVHALLSPGEIVIPRSAAQDPTKAKAFIDHIMKQQAEGEPEGYAKVLKAHKALEKRIKKLESAE